MWTEFNVRMDFLTKLCAGIPADPELITKWLEARKPKVRPPSSKSIAEVTAEVLETLPEQSITTETDATLHIFQRHPETKVLAVGMRTVRGHLKDICQVLSSLYVARIQGERSFAVKGKNGIYYPPELYWIPIVDQKTRRPFKEPHGIYDKAIHVNTPQGPRSALKSIEFVTNASLEFPLHVLTQPGGKLVVSAKDLETIFRYGAHHGYGPERGDGEGRYTFTLTQGKEID